MPVIQLHFNSTLVNGSFQFIINLSQPPAEVNTTTTNDSVGAMRFTIAVVLVYGIGVIGLLGISARRNRRMEAMDKEVNKFIKSKLSKYEYKKARKPKRTINKLIASFHSILQTDGTVAQKQGHQTITKTRFALNRANTWSGHSTKSKCTMDSLTNEQLTASSQDIPSIQQDHCININVGDNNSPDKKVRFKETNFDGIL